MSINVYEIVTNRIIEQLQNGVIPWRRPWQTVQTLAFNRRDGKPYSLINQLLLGKPGEYLTFKQCVEAGGHVRKGEKASAVVFWKIHTKMQPMPDGTEKQVTVPLLKYYSVFHIDQCEGISAKHPPEKLIGGFDPNEKAEEVIRGYTERTGVRIINECQNKACYRPSTDEILLPQREQFSCSADYYAALFHEMAHSTGHDSRLARIRKGASFGDDDYSKEELVAEIAAATIMNMLGIETEQTEQQTAAYVKHWIQALKSDSRMIVSAASKAEKAVKLIMNEQVEEKQDENQIGAA